MPMDPFQAFVVQRRADFRRIARQTDGEHTAEDVENEAWLIAERIAVKRGSVVNFSLRTDQELVLAWLHNELVRYADKQIRYAVKLDKDWDNDDAELAENTLARTLAAPDVADPAVYLLRRQEVPDLLALAQHSYSQAAAYGILLHRFERDAEELAAHIRISTSTLHGRLQWFMAWIRWQSSLFDGVQAVPVDFEPTKARLLAPRPSAQDQPDRHQLVWTFDAHDQP